MFQKQLISYHKELIDIIARLYGLFSHATYKANEHVYVNLSICTCLQIFYIPYESFYITNENKKLSNKYLFHSLV